MVGDERLELPMLYSKLLNFQDKPSNYSSPVYNHCAILTMACEVNLKPS